MIKPKNRAEVLELLLKQKSLLEQQYYVKRLGVFGSFARDEANENSDLDLLVEFDAPIPVYIENKVALGEYLENLFQRHVDMANPNSLNAFYKDRIIKQAIYV
jgi:predicted nucleotidyltransferase